MAKKVVIIVKNNVFERLYQKLETKEGEKVVFKLARANEKKTRLRGTLDVSKVIMVRY